MNFNPVNLLIAFVISALVTYGLTSLDSNSMQLAIGIGSFIFLASTLSLAFGVGFENERAGTNIRVVSGVFFVVALLVNLLFSFVQLSPVSYIITCGITFLIYVLIANGIYSAKQ